MTKQEILNKVNELNKTKWNERTSEWYKEYRKLKEHKIFFCEECQRFVDITDLESWLCNFEDGHERYLCSLCYETSMGDDL